MSRKAAQYVRMSTDDQVGSIEIQKQAILEYARLHEFEIVATYADAGKSGITLKNRDAMRRLLQDVVGPNCPFEALLVLDVSRWGRFQDVDESAYYEYMCRKSGVQVIYVAEPFSTRTGPTESLIKQLKRVMAAEYSRELGMKVRAGQERRIRERFVGGGLPRFGYERLAFGADGRPKWILGSGERKPNVTDAVRWVPGPPSAVEIVQRIFDAYTQTPMSALEIATLLNAEGHRTIRGAEYSTFYIKRILAGELYRGNYVWRNTSRVKSSLALVEQIPVRIDNFVDAIVSAETWERAAAKLAKGEPNWHRKQAAARRQPADKALSRLRQAIEDNPSLRLADLRSLRLMTVDYMGREFGSFLAANMAAGRLLSPTLGLWQQRRHEGMQLARQVQRDVVALLVANGLPCVQDMKRRMIALADSGVTCRVKVAHPIDPSRERRWRTKIKPWGDEWLLLMRQERDGTGRDFYLLPPLLSLALRAAISQSEFDQLQEWQISNADELVVRMRQLADPNRVAAWIVQESPQNASRTQDRRQK